jgi:hypothetical protein
MLAKFANLPVLGRPERPDLVYMGSPCTVDLKPESKDIHEHIEIATRAAEEFREHYGDLAPGIIPPAYENFVVPFRYHWKWTRDGRGALRSRRYPVMVTLDRTGSGEKPQTELGDASAWARNILNRRAGFDYLGPKPALDVDFAKGRITVIPETLLDWLVLSLMECRTRLAICKRKRCVTPFFVKDHPKNKYCSPECSALAHDGQKREWEKRKHPTRKGHATKTGRTATTKGAR